MGSLWGADVVFVGGAEGSVEEGPRRWSAAQLNPLSPPRMSYGLSTVTLFPYSC